MAIKLKAGVSVGQPFSTGETRDVNVTAEGLSLSSGFEGDTVTYTATVLDDTAAKVPATFVASLKINGVDLILDQIFDALVYDQATGLLTLDFIVPAAVGAFTVTLEWIKQIF